MFLTTCHATLFIWQLFLRFLKPVCKGISSRESILTLLTSLWRLFFNKPGSSSSESEWTFLKRVKICISIIISDKLDNNFGLSSGVQTKFFGPNYIKRILCLKKNQTWKLYITIQMHVMCKSCDNLAFIYFVFILYLLMILMI